MKLTIKQKRLIANVICNDTELVEATNGMFTENEVNNLQIKLREWL